MLNKPIEFVRSLSSCNSSDGLFFCLAIFSSLLPRYHSRIDGVCIMSQLHSAVVRFLILAAAMFSLSGFTQAQIDKAQQAAHFFAGEFEKCLAGQIERSAATNISSQDFALLIKGACLTEKNKFLVPLVDYIVMKNNAPASDQGVVLSIANSVITQYYDAAVRSFVERRSNR